MAATGTGILLVISEKFLLLLIRVIPPGMLLTLDFGSNDGTGTDTTGGSRTPSTCLDKLIVLMAGETTSCVGDVFFFAEFSTSPEEYDLFSFERRRFLFNLGKPESADFEGAASAPKLLAEPTLSNCLWTGGPMALWSPSLMRSEEFILFMATGVASS